MPVASAEQSITAPPNRVAELLLSCLAASGWRIQFINEDLAELIANLSKTERRSGMSWEFEYRCVARWQPQGNDVAVTIEVSEERNNWTQSDCKTQCDTLMQSLVQTASRLVAMERVKPKPNRYGTARWGNHEDLVAAGYTGGQEDPRRLILGPGFDENYATLTPEDSYKHAVVCGPTGSGKTTAVFIPNLIDRPDCSFIVTEATAGNDPPDLYWKSSGFRFHYNGQAIFYFNPDDLRSDRINPIDVVTTYAQAQELAQLIIENTTSKNNYGDDVWPKSESNLLAILIAHAAAEKQHLGYVRSLLTRGPDGLTPTMAKSAVEQVRTEYKGFCNNAREGFKYGVFAGLMQRLALWVNPRIVALTEKTDIDLEALQHRLFTFYLATPAQKTHLKPIASLIFNFILGLALEKDFDYPLALSLDEFTNFGNIPGIPDKLSIIRHKKIGVMLGFQDFSQLIRVYSKDDAAVLFSQPGTKFFFRTRALETAEKLSKMAGNETVYDRKISSSGQIQEKETGRPLIDPGAVLAMDEEKVIVFTPRTPPLMMPRFSWQDYDDAMSFEPIVKREIEIDERLVRECSESTEQQPWQDAGAKALTSEVSSSASPIQPGQQIQESPSREKSLDSGRTGPLPEAATESGEEQLPEFDTKETSWGDRTRTNKRDELDRGDDFDEDTTYV